MRSFRTIVVAALLTALSVAWAADVEVKGSVTKGKTTMPIVDAVALWTPAKQKLKVILTPTKLEKSELELLRKDDKFFLMRKATPDASKWKKWYPWVELSFRLDPKKQGKDSVRQYLLYLKGVLGEGDDDNLNADAMNMGDKLKSFSFAWDDAAKTGKVDLSFAGDDEIGGEAVSWDVQFSGPVVLLEK